jgi:hypothetical protein
LLPRFWNFSSRGDNSGLNASAIAEMGP